MEKFTVYMIFIMALEFGIVAAEPKEVLIRDRLVLVLCDQVDEYLASGSFPAAIKSTPEKYKNFKAGSGSDTGGEQELVGGGNAMNSDGTLNGDPNDPKLPSGRKVSKTGRTTANGIWTEPTMKNAEKNSKKSKRAIATKDEGMEENPKGHCLLDLN